MRPRRRHSNLEPPTSNLCLFSQFRTLWRQRSTSKPFPINHFRTLSHATGGGGASAISHFKCGDSSIFHGSRNTAHGPCPYGDFSTFLRLPTVDCQVATVLSALPIFAPCYLVCFHANTNCPVCKPFVFITIRIAGGGYTPCPVLTSSFTLTPYLMEGETCGAQKRGDIKSPLQTEGTIYRAATGERQAEAGTRGAVCLPCGSLRNAQRRREILRCAQNDRRGDATRGRGGRRRIP